MTIKVSNKYAQMRQVIYLEKKFWNDRPAHIDQLIDALAWKVLWFRIPLSHLYRWFFLHPSGLFIQLLKKKRNIYARCTFLNSNQFYRNLFPREISHSICMGPTGCARHYSHLQRICLNWSFYTLYACRVISHYKFDPNSIEAAN